MFTKTHSIQTKKDRENLRPFLEWNVLVNILTNCAAPTRDIYIYIDTGWAITYGKFREIASRLQTTADTVILRPFLKCPAFLHLGKYKKPLCQEKGVKSALFQSKSKNSWHGFLEFHIWRTFSNIHFFSANITLVWYIFICYKGREFQKWP